MSKICGRESTERSTKCKFGICSRAKQVYNLEKDIKEQRPKKKTILFKAALKCKIVCSRGWSLVKNENLESENRACVQVIKVKSCRIF